MADNSNGNSKKKKCERYRARATDATNKQKRQAKYLKFLNKKLLQLITRGKSTAGVEKEIAFMQGKQPRPEFATGAAARQLMLRKPLWDH